MYKVIERFVDLMDSNHVYVVGDEFPRHGHVVSEERINELSGSDNKRKMPLITNVEESKARIAAKAEVAETTFDDVVEEAKARSKKQKK